MHNENIEPLAPQPGVEPVPNALPTPATSLCANCGAELLGSTCYSCGQPVKGMVRHLSSILADVGDTILNIDSRIFRTLWPLLVKPGFLTNEYLAGRRVRYVTPFRLYFFLSVIAFLIMQLSLDATLDTAKDAIRFDTGGDDIAQAQSPQDVQTRRDLAIAELEKSKGAPGLPAKGVKGIDKAIERLRNHADERLRYLQAVEDAKAKGLPAPADKANDSDLEIGSKRWDPKAHPLRIAWLPAFVNTRINLFATRAVENLPRIRKDPRPFLIGAFGSLPQVLFVLMPMFALLLKIFYIFKRRLYMEHLMVALHSHSFIFLSLLLITLVGLLRDWAGSTLPFPYIPLGWLMFALGWWIPIYLLIMQKRVYRQGWFLTVLKYLTIGLCYTILISIGVAVAFVISLGTV